MQMLTDRFRLQHFWAMLRRASEAILLLDFDGTLAPFVADPALARPYPGVVELLHQIIALEKTRLVIVSGREVVSLEGCLGLDPSPELWGCHGWQRRLPGGHTLQRGISDSVAELLEQAAELVQGVGFAAQLEFKPVALALHWRGLDADSTAYLRDHLGDQWRQLVVGTDLQLKGFDGGLELRCAGVNKGTVVSQQLLEVGEGALLAYLGDDLTDEDAFQVLGERGLKVLVRPQLRETAADLWLQPPLELIWFLQQWHLNCGGAAE